MTRRSHKHPPYPEDDPRYEQWPDCPYPTKKECQAAVRVWKAEIKDHDAKLKAERKAAQKAAREVAYLEYQHSEQERIARGGSPV